MSGPERTGVLLMICYKFPPMHSVSCKRTWALHEQFKTRFKEVVVISTTNRHVLQQSDVKPVGANVHDAETRDYRTYLQAGRNKQASATEGAKQTAVGRLGLKMQASFPTLYWLGEGGRRYTRSALSLARQLVTKHSVTHIFSSFPPYADHVVAYRLKEQFPGLTWIADFRDLHVDPAQDNLFFRDHQIRRNREILKSAEVITTVSEGLATHLRKLHRSVYVLRNGIVENETAVPLREKFTIAYTGSMFQNKRRPEPLLQVLADALQNSDIDQRKVAVVYAGKDGDVWLPKIKAFGLDGIFENVGWVNEKKAREIQSSSHINVLLTYSTPDLKGNLTGKLYDYLEAGRPILVLINGPDDAEIRSIITASNAGFVVHEDSGLDSLHTFLTTAYREWEKSGTVTAHFNRDYLQELHWSQIVDNFLRETTVRGILQNDHV